jgi:hypothetical protein
LTGTNTAIRGLFSSYLTTATASSTYQTQAGMSSYLTTSTASSTYAPLASPTFTGSVQLQSTGQIQFYNSSYFIRASTGLELQSADLIRFLTNGANERMRINSSGNMGIGTTTIPYKLVVVGDTNTGIAGFGGNNNGVLPGTNGDLTLVIGTNYSAGSAEANYFHNDSTYSGTNGGHRFLQRTGASTAADILWVQQNLSRFYTSGSERMRIDSSGNVGIGTSSPSQKLHVAGTGYSSSDFRAPIFYDSDDTGYYVNPNSTSKLNVLTVQQLSDASTNGRIILSGNLHIDAFNGFDIYANYYSSRRFRTYYGTNAESFRTDTDGIVYAFSQFRTPIFYDYDNTGYYVNPNGVTSLGGVNDIPLRVLKTSGVNSTCAQFLNQYGDNSWGVVAEFKVGSGSGSDRPSILFSNGYDSNTWTVGFGYADSSYFRINRDHGYVNQSWGTTLMSIDRSGNAVFAGNVSAYSDERLKKNIKKIERPLEIIEMIDGVTFNYIEDDREGLGVIAQQLEKVLPILVSETTNSQGEIYKNVAYGNMVGLLIEGIKEQQNQIVELRNELQALRGTK